MKNFSILENVEYDCFLEKQTYSYSFTSMETFRGSLLRKGKQVSKGKKNKKGY